MLAVLRLESFSQAPMDAEAETRKAVEAAYASGLAEGRRAQQEDRMTALTREVLALAAALSADEARRAALRAEAVAALTPLLSAILDGLASGPGSQRLEAALQAELQRLAAEAQPLRCTIACDRASRPMVERCLAAAGADASFTVADAEVQGVRLSLEGGHIEFDRGRVAEGLRALIAEIQEDTP